MRVYLDTNVLVSAFSTRGLYADVVRVDLAEHELVIRRPSKESTTPVRDPDDRWVLASAEAAGVDVLVTGDHDLLEVAGQAAVRIVDPRGFWRLVQESGKDAS